MPTVTGLDVETLESQPIMPNNLPEHCPQWVCPSSSKCAKERLDLKDEGEEPPPHRHEPSNYNN